jgi:hypothetical protein
LATLNFVKGSIQGRVGEFVGSSWKGKSYIKTFTAPSNPKTVGQVAIRTVFQHIIHIASQINPIVLKPFTFPRPQKQTPVNRMVHINRELFGGKVWNPEKLSIFEGPLFNSGIESAVIENEGTVSAQVKVTFSSTLGDGADKAVAVIYDGISQKALAAVADRQAGQVLVSIATLDPADLSDLHAYLVFSQPPAQGTPESGQVSGTAYLKVDSPV